MPARRRHFSSDDDHSESINMAMNEGIQKLYHLNLLWNKNGYKIEL